MTSIGASALFPQFMYESILKTATDDKDFSFKVRSTAYPAMREAKFESAKLEASMIVFILAIAYSQFLSIVVGYLVDERVSKLKFFQSTQGMQLAAYWIANFTFDMVKLYLIVGANIAIFFGFGIRLGDAVWTLLLYPLGIVPFSYVTTFIF